MQHALTPHVIDGRQCWTALPFGPGDHAALPVVYLATGTDYPDQHEAIMDAFLQKAGGHARPFLLVSFASADWDRDYSPWAAPPLFKKSAPFSGGAPDTLAWLTDSLMPFVQQRYSPDNTPARQMLLGYSLAGLFSLWAAYESGRFTGCGSCSGSLWYDDWLPYARERHMPAQSRVYLSLGDREGKARNQRMAAVEPATQEMATLLAADPCVADTVLTWPTGGHFDDASQRLADALLWLTQN